MVAVEPHGRLRGVTFENWMRSHRNKAPKERWLRELYPWPVLARVDCNATQLGKKQRIIHDGVSYHLTVKAAKWQEDRGTYRYRVLVESDGLGWHARSFADEFDLCAGRDGSFVTLFHVKKEEPLEKIARAFFSRRWTELDPESFQTLAVSRFLAAALVSEAVADAFSGTDLQHYPYARATAGPSPMFSAGSDLWIGHRFFSENAYEWARRSADRARRVIAFYFADTKYQYRIDLPRNAEVLSLTELDATKLEGRYEDLIRTLQRRLEVPAPVTDHDGLWRIVTGNHPGITGAVTEGDVHEALAALQRPCGSKDELRYQLAAAVVLNAWIEGERNLGFPQRKKFYAFKRRVDELARWAKSVRPPGVTIWAEALGAERRPVIYIRIDDIDFSFHEISFARELCDAETARSEWSGVRLKPVASFLLQWARYLRQREIDARTRGGT